MTLGIIADRRHHADSDIVRVVLFKIAQRELELAVYDIFVCRLFVGRLAVRKDPLRQLKQP